MSDRAELETVLSVQADRVLAGLDSFERSLGRIEQQHKTTGVAAEEHGRKVEDFIGKMGRLADVGKLFVAWEAVERVIGALSGVQQFNIDMLRTTEILGGNAEAASTWVVIAHEMGIEAQNVDRAFAHLASSMNSGSSPALKQMGIAAEDSHGKLRPLNDVLNDAAEYFRRHAGAVNNAALANELFGRSGYLLLPVLEQGKAGIAAITEEARKYGLILNAETVQRNAAFTFQLKEAQLAAEGFGLSLGNAALPAVAALGQAFSRVISDNLPAFIAAINRAASYVIGFVEALTGMELHVGEGALALSSLAGIAGDTGTALGDAGAGARALAEAEARVRDHAKDATAAIDDQVRALQAQSEAARFADQQAKLQENLKNKAQDIQDLQRERYQQFWLGNFQTASDVGEKITRAEQDQANIQKQLAAGVTDENSKLQISALEAQKRSVQKAADDQIAAMQRAAHGTTEALTAAASAMGPIFGKGGADAAKSLKFALDSSAEGIGKSMGKNLMDALFGPEVWKFDAMHPALSHFERSGTQWEKLGGAIGQSIVVGMRTAVGAGISGWVHEQGDKLAGVANQIANSPAAMFPGTLGLIAGLRAEASALQHFHSGGVVQGARGSDQVVVARAGERVMTEGQNDDIVSVLVEQNSILRAMLSALNTRGSGGGMAALNALLDEASRSRRRGITGVFA